MPNSIRPDRIPWIYCHHCQQTSVRNLVHRGSHYKTFRCEHCGSELSVPRHLTLASNPNPKEATQ